LKINHLETLDQTGAHIQKKEEKLVTNDVGKYLLNHLQLKNSEKA
jgi:hypothetical protein